MSTLRRMLLHRSWQNCWPVACTPIRIPVRAMGMDTRLSRATATGPARVIAWGSATTADTAVAMVMAAAMAVGTATGTTITTIGKVGATDDRTNWAPFGSCVFLHKDPASG